MRLKPDRSLQLLLAALLVFSQIPVASAIGLLLPAVQAAPEAKSSAPLIADIDRLGLFEVTSNGSFPILSLDIGGGIFDAREGVETSIVTALLNLDFRSSKPLEIENRMLDVIIALYPSDPVIRGQLNFLTTSESPDGMSAKGELKGAFNFIVEVSLIDFDDKSIIETFMQSGMIELSGGWHSEDRRLIFDDPLMVSGMLKGSLTPVPLPASLLFMLSGLVGIATLTRRFKRRS